MARKPQRPGANAPPAVRLVNGERLSVLGWGRAILMQLAHPLVGAGVADHSAFRTSRLGWLRRLHGTVNAMLALSFGDDPEARRAAEGINEIHDRVQGRLREPAGPYPAGTPYSAHDPELLLWVHTTLLESILLTYEKLVGPLAPRVQNDYVAASAIGMARLGLPPDRTPTTLADVHRHVDAVIAAGTLGVTDRTRALADTILNPPLAWLALPIATTQRLLIVGTLPAAVRELYGFRWTARDERQLERRSVFVRRLHAWTPARVTRFAAASAPRA